MHHIAFMSTGKNERNPTNNPGYRKGDQHSGGGGGNGGGGKKGRPVRGWEKGDVVRDVEIQRSPDDLPVKPNRHLDDEGR